MFKKLLFTVLMVVFLLMISEKTKAGSTLPSVQDLKVNVSNETMERVKNLVENPFQKLDAGEREKLERKARESVQVLKSEKFKKEGEKLLQPLKEVLAPYYQGYLKDGKEKAEKKKEAKDRGNFYQVSNDTLVLGEGKKLYVFVSSSMPESLIRTYVISAVRRIKGGKVRFVLRGAIGGLTRLMPTAKWLINILRVDNSCNPFRERCRMYGAVFLIDPLLYRKFHVDRVPCFVLVDERTGKTVKTCGDFSLFYQVKRMLVTFK